MVVSEHSDRATRKYATLEEAELVAEELTRRTGQDVYILKPFCKASTHRVKWENIEEA
jgi:predicted phage-related endonuclease